MIAITVLSICSLKLREVHEEFYFLNIFLYFTTSSVRINLIPVGFMFCLLIIFTHTDMKNRKAKIVAIVLGFILYAIAIIFHLLGKPLLTLFLAPNSKI